MNDLDDRILKALESEDRELLERYKEPKLIYQIGRSFRGEMGMVIAMIVITGLAIAVLMVVCAYYYFNSLDPQVHELSSIGFICSFVGAAFTKLFFYNHLGQLNILREVKRLELQVSLLAGKNK